MKRSMTTTTLLKGNIELGLPLSPGRKHGGMQTEKEVTCLHPDSWAEIRESHCAGDGLLAILKLRDTLPTNKQHLIILSNCATRFWAVCGALWKGEKGNEVHVLGKRCI